MNRNNRRFSHLSLVLASLLIMPMLASGQAIASSNDVGTAQPTVQDHPSPSHHDIPRLEPELPHIQSLPQHEVMDEPKRSSGAGPGELQAVVTPVVSPTINAKLLVISADGTEVDLPGIKQALDYLGAPYTVFTATVMPELTAAQLFSGSNGFYQGVILTTGSLGYFDGTNYVSALSPTEWNTLWDYEAAFGVRQVTWYTYPTADYGFGQPVTGVNTDPPNALAASFTSGGRSLFSYVNGNNPVTINWAYTYLAQPLTDGSTTPLLSDASGNALAAVRAYPDGRANLALTFDSNQYLTHNLQLSYGVINWIAKGLFLGERHIYIGAQVDDLLIDDDTWLPVPGVHCPAQPPPGQTPTFRMSDTDFNNARTWQNGVRAQPNTAALRLDLAFNGFGSTGIYSPDTLTPAVRSGQGDFKWINHTWDHQDMNPMTYAQAKTEIIQNISKASNLGLQRFNRRNLITPEISGLGNPDMLRAAKDVGVRYLVSDSSRPGQGNPSPNAGIYNQYQPTILEIPRRPVNLYYNVSTPEEWMSEYNCFYRSYWGRDLSYEEILDNVSNTLLSYLLKGENDPWMFHQTNLRAYDSTHTLLTDLLDRTLTKYNSKYQLPIVSPNMTALGQTVADRMGYNASGVTAQIKPGQIVLTSPRAAKVPVTGARTTGAELYGGQYITYVQISAGQTVTVTLQP